MIVIDSSALIRLLLVRSDERAVRARLFGGGQVLQAPHLIDIEVAQVLRRFVRQQKLDVDRARSGLLELATMPLERHDHDVLLPRIWQLRANLTAYDATYVALAELLDAPLVTRDARMLRAPGHTARIELI